MTRPVDWTPLSDRDPAPGDPTEIARLARRYGDTADEVTRQAANLRKLATTEGWDADAGQRFAEEAGDLAGKLQRAHGRYFEVAAALRDWGPHLVDVQDRADRALEQAKAAQADMEANRAVASAGVVPTTTPTPAEIAAEKRRADAYEAAEGRLDAARRDLAEAVDDRDEWARSAAQRIRAAIDHDGLKDSPWDKFKGWVSDNARWIKAVTEVLSWVATGLAIAALFIPGLNIIAALALAATLTAFLGHIVLAAAGSGSWGDALIDAIGLATLGAGNFAMKGVRGAQLAVRSAGARTAARGAAAQTRAATRAERVALAQRVGRGGPRARAAARQQLDALKAQTNRAARDAAQRAEREVMEQALPPTTLRDRIIAGGNDELARIALDIDQIASRYPLDRAVASAWQAAKRPILAANVAYRANMTVDFLDKAQATAPLKNMPVFQHEMGSTW